MLTRVVAQPVGEGLDRLTTLNQTDDFLGSLVCVSRNPDTVNVEEDQSGRESRPLIPVHERVIQRNAANVGRCQRKDILLAVREVVLRAASADSSKLGSRSPAEPP